MHLKNLKQVNKLFARNPNVNDWEQLINTKLESINQLSRSSTFRKLLNLRFPLVISSAHTHWSDINIIGANSRTIWILPKIIIKNRGDAREVGLNLRGIFGVKFDTDFFKKQSHGKDIEVTGWGFTKEYGWLKLEITINKNYRSLNPSKNSLGGICGESWELRTEITKISIEIFPLSKLISNLGPNIWCSLSGYAEESISKLLERVKEAEKVQGIFKVQDLMIFNLTKNPELKELLRQVYRIETER